MNSIEVSSRNFKFPVKEIRKTQDTLKSELDFNQEYVRRLLETASDGVALTNLLTEDTKHLIFEVVFRERETTYDYWLDVSGVDLKRESYLEGMEAMCLTLVNELAAKGQDANRAIITTLAMESVRQFFAAQAQKIAAPTPTPTTSVHKLSSPSLPRLLMASPPGLTSEGYAGSTCILENNIHAQEEHHSFWYLFTADQIDFQYDKPNNTHSPQRVHLTVHQFRTQHNLAQFLDVYKEAGQPLSIDKNASPLEISHQICGKLLVFNPDQDLVPKSDNSNPQLANETTVFLATETTTQSLSAKDNTLNFIDDFLFSKYQDSWFYPPDSHISAADKKIQLPQATYVLENFYLPLTINMINNFKTKFPKPKQQEKHLANFVSDFNNLRSFFIAAVHKHTSEKRHYTTAQLEELCKNLVFAFLDLNPNSYAFMGKKLNLLPFSLKKILGKKKHAALNISGLSSLLTLGNSLSSAAQCTVLAPISLAAKAGNSASGGFSMPNFKLAEWAKNKGYKPWTWRLKDREETYLIPPQHYSEYAKGSYIKNNQVFGPCHIPLIKDKLVVLSQTNRLNSLPKKNVSWSVFHTFLAPDSHQQAA